MFKRNGSGGKRSFKSFPEKTNNPRQNKSAIIPFPVTKVVIRKVFKSRACKDAAGADRNLWISPASCAWYPESKKGFIFHFQPSHSAYAKYELNPYSTYLIPQGSDYDVCAETLLPGNTWYDPWGGIEFTHKGISQEGAALEINTPYMDNTVLRLAPPARKPKRRSFSYQISSSTAVTGLQKSDIFFKKGSCKIGFLWSSFVRKQSITLRACRPGRTQIGIRAESIKDEWWRSFPATEVLSPVVRVPRR